MHSDDDPAVSIRPMAHTDRATTADLVVSAGNFNQAEIDCALELVGVYLTNEKQTDYQVVAAQDGGAKVSANACSSPVPMTKGAFDLYWIATRPEARGQGLGRALMDYVESKALEMSGRLPVGEPHRRRPMPTPLNSIAVSDMRRSPEYGISRTSGTIRSFL